MSYFAHESAYIDEPCQIGEGSKIWHFSHIMSGAKIGRSCSLGQNVNIAGDVVIGDGVKIQNNVSLYTGTKVEDGVFLGPSCVFTNVTYPRAEINRRSEYENTLLKHGCTIGANATIVCGITIGRYAFVGAGAVVSRDIPDYALVVGVPARQKGWAGRHGRRLLPDSDDPARFICPESGLNYLLEDSKMRCIKEDDRLC